MNALVAKEAKVQPARWVHVGGRRVCCVSGVLRSLRQAYDGGSEMLAPTPELHRLKSALPSRLIHGWLACMLRRFVAGIANGRLEISTKEWDDEEGAQPLFPIARGIRIQTPFFGERNSTDGPLRCQGRG